MAGIFIGSAFGMLGLVFFVIRSLRKRKATPAVQEDGGERVRMGGLLGSGVQVREGNSPETTIRENRKFNRRHLFLRLTAVVIFFVWSVIVGKLAGPLLLGMVGVSCLDIKVDFNPLGVRLVGINEDRIRKHGKRWLFPLVMMGGLLTFLSRIHVFVEYDYVWSANELWYSTKNSGGLLSPTMTYFRFLSMVAIPWIAVKPYTWAVWSIMIEQGMKHIRDAMPGKIDLSNFNWPDGKRIKGLSAAQEEKAPESPLPTVFTAGISEDIQ